MKTKTGTQPKLLSKRIENASLASFFAQMWGGVHDPVDLKRTFARGKRPSATQHLVGGYMIVSSSSDLLQRSCPPRLHLVPVRIVGVGYMIL